MPNCIYFVVEKAGLYNTICSLQLACIYSICFQMKCRLQLTDSTGQGLIDTNSHNAKLEM